MQSYWLKKEGNSRLIIFALGWASDYHAVEHLDLAGYDALCLYDYRTITPIEEILKSAESKKQETNLPNKGVSESTQSTACNQKHRTKRITKESAGEDLTKKYGRIYLIAWSFGVLASEYIFRNTKPYRAIAINGTKCPIDDKYGIPHRSFALTLRSIPRMGVEEFNRRTFGKYYDHMAPFLEDRPFEHKLEELAELGCLAKKSPEAQNQTQKEQPETNVKLGCSGQQCNSLHNNGQQAVERQLPNANGIKWDRAVVGGCDTIFSPENMSAYWSAAGVSIDFEPDMPHYPFGDPQFITQKLLRTL